MAEPALLHLAYDLEWLGCELEYYGHKHAMEAFPESGPTWDIFREKQRGVIATVDKTERALKDSVKFNPSRLVGVDFPIEDTLDSLAELLAAVEEIRQAAVFAVHELPTRVRNFCKSVEAYLAAADSMRR